MTQPDPPPGLLRHQGFRRLWAAQAVSVLGAQICELALPLAAVEVLKATPFQVGLLAAVQYLPFLLFGLPAGAWVDRMRRRPVMITADLVRFAVLLTVPAAAFCGVLRMWLLYPVAFAVGVMTVFFDVASQSFLPTLVGEERLVEANTKLQLSQTAGQLAGPSAGGFLVQLLTAPVAVLANALGYAGSAVLLLLVRAAEPPIRDMVRPGLVAEVKDGLRYLFRHPLLRPITLSAGITNLFGLFGMVQAILVLYAVRDLRLSPAALGTTLAIANGGVLFGSLANGQVVRRLGVGPSLAWATFGLGGSVLLLPLATPGTAMPVLAVAMALAGLCASVFNINQISLRQTLTPASMRGRMTATLRFVVWGVIPVGTFVGGALARPLGLRGVLWIAGTGSVLAGLPLLASAVRSLRTIPIATPNAHPMGQETLNV
ncbi:MFS transporter [Streptantibioticus ferralitis]|uniref:MFS transporter n=1 Tax=Streptantibioticus ferralitis TaxID=236510 RepID=A0ABT5ZEQ2_9ACTN|nr:MFS transporter [Streptantibioticus ferralitis]MDF2261510.1 MFS transporter [Streptantibioticus ferralitis]